MVIVPRNLYKHDGRFFLVVSVVDGVAVCVDASTSGKPKDWKIFPEKEFSEKAEDLGEFLKSGTYENEHGHRVAIGLGPTILCEVMGPETMAKKSLLLHEVFKFFHGTTAIYRHVSKQYDA